MASVIVPDDTAAVFDAGAQAPQVVLQTDSLQVVVDADEEVAVVATQGNTPFTLGTSDFTVIS